MDGETVKILCAETGEQLRGFRLPGWDEIPELDYYMDQVLSLVERYLGEYPGFERKGLTASMVNNYVKQGVLHPPIKKRYGRAHLARLLMICILKTSLPILSVKRLLAVEQENEKEFYCRFIQLFDETNTDTADALEQSDPVSAAAVVCRTALRAQAEQAIAVRLCAELEE